MNCAECPLEFVNIDTGYECEHYCEEMSMWKRKLTRVYKGSLIQVNEKIHDWFGCVMIVDEVKSWGVQAYLKIPCRGNAFLRLNWEELKLLEDEAIYTIDDEEEEEEVM